MIITITAWPGTNTANICKSLALQLGLKYITEDKIKEHIAAENNIGVNELETRLSKEVFIAKVNEMLRNARSENTITDYGLASWLVHDADLRVFLHAGEHNRVKKIVTSMEMPFIMAKKRIKKEEEERKKKYLYEYGINIYDMQNFDIFINIDKLDEDGIISIIKKFMEKMKK